MDPTRFDRFAIAVGQHTPRRTVLGLLAALGLTGVLSKEVGAAVCRAGGERCGGGRGMCCSGICKGPENHKRCRCPQRRCCECGDGESVPCAYVESHAACVERCERRTGSIAAFSAIGSPEASTVRCKDTQCQFVDCVPV